MLILGRRPGDSVVIDGGITIVVLACERGGVRLGIEAPSDVTILRGEIVRQVADENRRASAGAEAGRAWVAALGAAAAAPTPADPPPEDAAPRPGDDAA